MVTSAGAPSSSIRRPAASAPRQARAAATARGVTLLASESTQASSRDSCSGVNGQRSGHVRKPELPDHAVVEDMQTAHAKEDDAVDRQAGLELSKQHRT